jgi:hypothetical protein
MALTDADRLQMTTMALMRYSVVTGDGEGNNGGYVELEDESVYPTIVNSGYIPTATYIATITATPGNFLLAFFISRSNSPVVSAPGWKVWGGFAPIRRDASITQRVWVLTKTATGSDTIQFDTGGAGANYIIWYELLGADVKVSAPINIGVSPVIGPVRSNILLSKSKDKLIIWAGHSCFYDNTSSQPIWQAATGYPLLAGDGSTSVVPNWILGCMVDAKKLSDWGYDGGSTSAGSAYMEFWHETNAICSILPVAINHA